MTTDTNTPEGLAEEFHAVYERLAPSFGYETRAETRTFDPTSPNGRLMVAVCTELLASLAAGAQAGAGEPLFLLHTGKLDSDGEQGEWDIEADSGVRVDEFCAKHPGQSIGLYARAAPSPNKD